MRLCTQETYSVSDMGVFFPPPLLSPSPLQLPYLELEKLNGIEEVKQYLHKKLLEVPL